MSISNPIGSRYSSRSVDLMVSLRRQMDDLNRQLGTHKKSETYGGLGLDRRLSLDLRAKLSAVDGFMEAIDGADFRIKLMTQNLQRLGQLAEQMKSDAAVAGFELGGDGRTFAQKSAEQRLKEAIDLLNADVAGRKLFAGRAVEKTPVESYDKIMNGDPATNRAGLKQLILERTQAELGANGLGRVTVSKTATSVSIMDEGPDLPFGFEIVGASTTGSGALSGNAVAGTPSTATFGLSAIPADGDTITLTLKDADDNTHTIQLTARTNVPTSGLTTAFQIGATVSDTVNNLDAAIKAALGEKATAVLKPRAATLAASEFFAGSPSHPPQRVSGTPATSATGMVAGTAANTMIWYTGDDASPSARGTSITRIDTTQSVPTGAQANEPAIQNVLAQFAVLAAESFSNTPADSARYSNLKHKIFTQLAEDGGAPKISDITIELASASSTMKAAKDRHRDAKAMLADALGEIETPNTEEVAAAILSLQTRLQASYQTTSMISRLSLVNYL